MGAKRKVRKAFKKAIKEAGGKRIGKSRYDMTNAVEKEKKKGKDK